MQKSELPQLVLHLLISERKIAFGIVIYKDLILKRQEIPYKIDLYHSLLLHSILKV